MKNSDARSAENDLHDFSANLHKLPTKPQALNPYTGPYPKPDLQPEVLKDSVPEELGT